MPDFDLDSALAGPVIPTFEEVAFEIELTPEDDAPENHFQVAMDNEEDAELDRRMIDDIQRRLEWGDLWAFCTVCVSASWASPDTDEEFTGNDYLGGCSYRNEADFKQPGGYYQDMQKRAYEDLMEQIKSGNGHAH